ERRAIILAVGVDVDPDRAGELRLSVEVPSPSVPPQQSMEAAGAGPREVVAHATGVSIVEAANRLRGRLERQPLWTQVIPVVVGEPAARQGVARVLDVFMRYDPLNARAYLYLTDGEAQAVLEQMPNAQALTALSGSHPAQGHRDDSPGAERDGQHPGRPHHHPGRPAAHGRRRRPQGWGSGRLARSPGHGGDRLAAGQGEPGADPAYLPGRSRRLCGRVGQV